MAQRRESGTLRIRKAHKNVMIYYPYLCLESCVCANAVLVCYSVSVINPLVANDKERHLAERMSALGVREGDIDETLSGQVVTGARLCRPQRACPSGPNRRADVVLAEAALCGGAHQPENAHSVTTSLHAGETPTLVPGRALTRTFAGHRAAITGIRKSRSAALSLPVRAIRYASFSSRVAVAIHRHGLFHSLRRAGRRKETRRCAPRWIASAVAIGACARRQMHAHSMAGCHAARCDTRHTVRLPVTAQGASAEAARLSEFSAPLHFAPRGAGESAL